MPFFDRNTGRFKQGSFREAIFHIESHRFKSGRRIQDHQFPFIQRNYAEDLGKKSDEFEITAFVVGPDYDFQRNLLLQALKQQGGGLLVHPYLGEIQVHVMGFELQEDKDNRDFCRFRMTFIESGGREYPNESIDDTSFVDLLEVQVKDSSLSTFQRLYSTAGQGIREIQGIRDSINNFLSFMDTIKQAQGVLLQGLSELELTIATLGSAANRLRLLPGTLLGQITDVLDSFENTFSTARGRFDALIALSGRREIITGEFRGSNADQEARNQLALSAMFRARPLAGALAAANTITFTSRAEAFRYRDQFLREIDSLINSQVVLKGVEVATFPLDFLELLEDLRSAVILRFPIFNSVSSSPVEKKFDQETNAIVGLYEIFGSTNGLEFFLDDNQIFDGFISAGQTVMAERQLG